MKSAKWSELAEVVSEATIMQTMNILKMQPNLNIYQREKEGEDAYVYTIGNNSTPLFQISFDSDGDAEVFYDASQLKEDVSEKLTGGLRYLESFSLLQKRQDDKEELEEFERDMGRGQGYSHYPRWTFKHESTKGFNIKDGICGLETLQRMIERIVTNEIGYYDSDSIDGLMKCY